jgi:hypothetical protein
MVFAVGFWVFGLGLLGLLVLVLWVAALVDLVRRPDLDRRQRSGWILFVVLLPVIGSIVYFVRRPILPEEREKMIAAETQRH